MPIPDSRGTWHTADFLQFNPGGILLEEVSLHPKAFPCGMCVEERTLFEMFLLGGSWPCLPCSFLSEAAAKGGFPANGKRGVETALSR